jgi:sporulation integral membrane protein YtvI
MPQNPAQAVYKIVFAILVIFIFRFALLYLLPWTAPFIIAFAIAALIEPLVRRMTRGVLSRDAASGLCTILFFGTFLSILALVCIKVSSELKGVASSTSELFQGIIVFMEQLELKARDIADDLPVGIGRQLTALIDAAPDQLTSLPVWLSGRLLGLLSALAENVPPIFLFIVTTGIGVYFFSSTYPAVLRFISRQVSENHRELFEFLRTDLLKTLAGWIRAQLILMALVFAGLLIAFTLLGVDYALLMALVTAIIDALPVLGVGMVLIPWTLMAFFTGKPSIAIGLAITCAAVTIMRSIVQPKLLGDSLGLHPVVTLIAIYIGFCTMGIWGMLIFPLLAITIKQLNTHGFIHLWKRDERVEAK